MHFSSLMLKKQLKCLKLKICICSPSQKPTPLRGRVCAPVLCAPRSTSLPSKRVRWWSRPGWLRRNWTSGRSEPSQRGEIVKHVMIYTHVKLQGWVLLALWILLLTVLIFRMFSFFKYFCLYIFSYTGWRKRKLRQRSRQKWVLFLVLFHHSHRLLNTY